MLTRNVFTSDGESVYFVVATGEANREKAGKQADATLFARREVKSYFTFLGH